MLAVHRLVDELIRGAVAVTIMNRLYVQWAPASSAEELEYCSICGAAAIEPFQWLP